MGFSFKDIVCMLICDCRVHDGGEGVASAKEEEWRGRIVPGLYSKRT